MRDWASETIGELATALSKVQGVLSGAPKSSENPFFKSKYADLATVWDTCRGPLAENGLAIIQVCVPTEPPKVAVKTILAHTSGEWISGTIEMTPTKGDPQSVGSAITYARRYGLQAMVGIAPEDDDGNEASNGGPRGYVEKNPVWPGEGEPRRALKKDSSEYAAKVEKNRTSEYSPLAVKLSDEINRELARDDEPPAIFSEPDHRSGAAWLEHKRAMTSEIDRGDFQAKLEAIPQQVAAKIAAQDSGSMFGGTCDLPGCSAVLVTYVSESAANKGKEYWLCHWALQEKIRMKKEGFSDKAIAVALKDHTRKPKK